MFAGGEASTAAEPRRQLNTSQALPGMSQRMVASQLVTPSPHPRKQPLLVSSSPSRPLLSRHVHAPAASRSASPDPPRDEETGLRPSIFSAAGRAVGGEGSSKPAFTDGGTQVAAECQTKGASSWQLLQEGDSQPRMVCRSKKVSAVYLWKLLCAIELRHTA